MRFIFLFWIVFSCLFFHESIAMDPFLEGLEAAEVLVRSSKLYHATLNPENSDATEFLNKLHLSQTCWAEDGALTKPFTPQEVQWISEKGSAIDRLYVQLYNNYVLETLEHLRRMHIRDDKLTSRAQAQTILVALIDDMARLICLDLIDLEIALRVSDVYQAFYLEEKARGEKEAENVLRTTTGKGHMTPVDKFLLAIKDVRMDIPSGFYSFDKAADLEEKSVKFLTQRSFLDAMGGSFFTIQRIEEVLNYLEIYNILKRMVGSPVRPLEAFRKFNTPCFANELMDAMPRSDNAASYVKRVHAERRRGTNRLLAKTLETFEEKGKELTQKYKARWEGAVVTATPSVASTTTVREKDMSFMPKPVPSRKQKTHKKASRSKTTSRSKVRDVERADAREKNSTLSSLQVQIDSSDAQPAGDREEDIESTLSSPPLGEVPEVLVAEAKDTAASAEEDTFYEWWKAYAHKSPQPKVAALRVSPDAPTTANTSPPFQFRLSAKPRIVYEYIMGMRGFQTMHTDDMIQLLNEIHRQFEVFKSNITLQGKSRILNRAGKRPFYALPNLTTSSEERPYLVYPLPHFGHAGRDPLYFDLLRIFFKRQFSEAGFTPQNLLH